jgi:hypothetical protein
MKSGERRIVTSIGAGRLRDRGSIQDISKDAPLLRREWIGSGSHPMGNNRIFSKRQSKRRTRLISLFTTGRNFECVERCIHTPHDSKIWFVWADGGTPRKYFRGSWYNDRNSKSWSSEYYIFICSTKCYALEFTGNVTEWLSTGGLPGLIVRMIIQN